MKLEIFLLTLILGWCAVEGFHTPWRAKCEFHNSVNITGGKKDDKGNYEYNGVVYAPGTFQLIDFTRTSELEIIKTDFYVRGCTCLYRPCVRFCCEESECVKEKTVKMNAKNDNDLLIDLQGSQYGILTQKPCSSMYKLEEDDYADDRWSLQKVS